MSVKPISMSKSSSSVIPVPHSKGEDVAPEIQWRVPEVDGVRGLAMLMVLIYHAWEFADRTSLTIPIIGVSLGSVLELLPAGVDLFMVLSGFCLFLPICRGNREQITFDAKKYVKRRLRRIIPPYYAAILFALILPNILVILFLILGKEAKWQSIPSIFQLVTHLTFTHLFFVETWDGITGAFWSLGLEAQFYLVFPLVVFFYKKFGIQVVWWMLLISVLYRVGVAIGFEITNNNTDNFSPFRFLWDTNLVGRWMQFAAGIWAAYFISEQWKNNRIIDAKYGGLLLLAAVAIFSVSSIQLPKLLQYLPIRDVLLALSYASLLIAVCATATQFKAFFGSRVMTWLGYVSYTIFLIHQPVIYYLGQFVNRFTQIDGVTKFLVILIGGFIATLLITLPFFRFFEYPFLNVKSKPKEEVNTELIPVTS
jgi:peptidoglycan/LPS O-acetylase OafA/YrhL